MKVKLYRGIDNTIDFIIKKNKSTLPLTLVNGDTFKVHLLAMKDRTNKVTLSNEANADNTHGSVVITDGANGRLAVTFKSTFLSTLTSQYGDISDDFYVKALYSLLIEADTTNQGKFIVTVPRVAVG